jgi:hypothetical protein
MQRRTFMQRCRSASWKRWLGAALLVWLLLSESFNVTHRLDRAAHADGKPCAVCLSVSSSSAGAVAAEIVFVLEAAAPLIVATAVALLVSSVPVRRQARGPPAVSFAS